MQADQFINLYKQICTPKKDNDVSDWSAQARAWAVAQGLVMGSGTDDIGNPLFAWQDVLTREEMVTILFRFAHRNADPLPPSK